VRENLGLGEPSFDLRWTVVSIGGTWYVDDQDTLRMAIDQAEVPVSARRARSAMSALVFA